VRSQHELRQSKVAIQLASILTKKTSKTEDEKESSCSWGREGESEGESQPSSTKLPLPFEKEVFELLPFLQLSPSLPSAMDIVTDDSNFGALWQAFIMIVSTHRLLSAPARRRAQPFERDTSPSFCSLLS